ncbi:trypsin-like serine protease [uncultured Winogradskyella sp.]|uniref:trypsin-like serine protease n=1 Tax=uncultured Winogradskyella sp. TaxID=395353 RepID=UPI002621845C|nr:trypsin-like serine protease [uncultured Winogradskyella sp.]
MTELEANNLLDKITYSMENIPFISYAAVIENPTMKGRFLIEYGIVLNNTENFIYGAYQQCNIVDWAESPNTPKELLNYAKNSTLDFSQRNISLDEPFMKKIPFVEDLITEKTKYFSHITSGVEALNCNHRLSFEQHDLLKSGYSIGSRTTHYKGGTIGAFFQLIDDNSIYAITNQHVIGDRSSSQSKNEKVCHPAVGHTLDYEDEQARDIGWVKKLIINEDMDVGIVEISTEEVENIKSGHPEASDKYTRIISPEVGDIVFKYGINTKETNGKIISKNASCRVWYDHNGSRESLIMKNQIMVENMKADCGDSGSIVYNSNMEVLGLLFARDRRAKRAFFTSITKIFSNDNGNNINDQPPYNFKKFI